MIRLSSAAARSGLLGALLLTGIAWAGGSCKQPRDVAAIQTAALQQNLMVAALTCHSVNSYNQFVISHRPELLELDRALMNYFMQRNTQSGEADYHAYKTWLANTASMRSLHDPEFCRTAFAEFDAALDTTKPLPQVFSEEPVPTGIDIAACSDSTQSDTTPLQRSASLDDH
jgi:hypothetical protein